MTTHKVVDHNGQRVLFACKDKQDFAYTQPKNLVQVGKGGKITKVDTSQIRPTSATKGVGKRLWELGQGAPPTGGGGKSSGKPDYSGKKGKSLDEIREERGFEADDDKKSDKDEEPMDSGDSTDFNVGAAEAGPGKLNHLHPGIKKKQGKMFGLKPLPLIPKGQKPMPRGELRKELLDNPPKPKMELRRVKEVAQRQEEDESEGQDFGIPIIPKTAMPPKTALPGMGKPGSGLPVSPWPEGKGAGMTGKPLFGASGKIAGPLGPLDPAAKQVQPRAKIQPGAMPPQNPSLAPLPGGTVPPPRQSAPKPLMGKAPGTFEIPISPEMQSQLRSAKLPAPTPAVANNKQPQPQVTYHPEQPGGPPLPPGHIQQTIRGLNMPGEGPLPGTFAKRHQISPGTLAQAQQAPAFKRRPDAVQPAAERTPIAERAEALAGAPTPEPDKHAAILEGKEQQPEGMAGVRLTRPLSDLGGEGTRIASMQGGSIWPWLYMASMLQPPQQPTPQQQQYSADKIRRIVLTENGEGIAV